MQRRIWPLLTLTALLSGCWIPNMSERVALDRSADVAVSGRFLRADGSPLANTKVSFIKLSLEPQDLARTGIGLVGGLVGGIGAGVTTGSAEQAHETLEDIRTSVGGHFLSAQTDAAGSFVLTTKGHEVLNVYNQPHALVLSVADESGQSLSLDLAIREPRTELAPLRFWNAIQAPTHDATLEGELAVSWAPAAGAKTHVVRVFQEGRPVWQQSAAAQGLKLPGYLFANGGRFATDVLAQFEAHRASTENRAFTAAADAEKRLLAIASVTSGTGDALPHLHDGRLFFQDKLSAQTSTEVVIDLGEPQPTSRLVTYDLQREAEVFTAVEQGAWGASLGTMAAGWNDFDLRSKQVRFIRLVFTRPDSSPDMKAAPAPVTFHAAELRVVGP